MATDYDAPRKTDEEISAELAKHILERHGFDVAVAKTAAAAKEALRKSPPDLVLMDLSLPDLDGRLHSLAEHRGTKVLLVAYASW